MSVCAESIPCSLVIWATGIKCRPIVNKLRELIGLKVQNNFRGLVTDEYLEVLAQDIYATLVQEALSY
jgi:NADH dehydrogenase FAD-containing subunit